MKQSKLVGALLPGHPNLIPIIEISGEIPDSRSQSKMTYHPILLITMTLLDVVLIP